MLTITGDSKFNQNCKERPPRTMHLDLSLCGAAQFSEPMVDLSLRLNEHLCRLSAVPDVGARFFAVPTKVKAFGNFPVRAFALSASLAVNSAQPA